MNEITENEVNGHKRYTLTLTCADCGKVERAAYYWKPTLEKEAAERTLCVICSAGRFVDKLAQRENGFVTYSQTSREVYAGEGNWTKDIGLARVYFSEEDRLQDGIVGGMSLPYRRATDLLAADTLEKQIALDMRTHRSVIQEGSLDTLETQVAP